LTKSRSGPDLSAALLAPAARERIVAEVAVVLGVDIAKARAITHAFDSFVAAPLEANFRKLNGRDLAKRNPMIYTARGTTSATEWIDRVLEDRETSAVEGHLGTFLEEVARIVSGGIKPGSGVDLQVDDDDGTIRLYAIQASPNTKNSGSRKSDVDSLKRSARPLRAARRHVELNIGVLHGRAKTGELRAEPGIHVLGSDDFWHQVSGIPDFRARLLHASSILSELIRKRSGDEVARIRAEAMAIYSDDSGALKMDSLANPPARIRSKVGRGDDSADAIPWPMP
jgi:hypothetical protein